MKKTVTVAMLLSAAALAASAFAAPAGPGGPGGGGGPGRFNFDKSNVPGWSLMTSDERTEHMNRMHSAKTYDECKTYQQEHHALMQERAKEKGVTLPTPRANACDRMKARGFFK